MSVSIRANPPEKNSRKKKHEYFFRTFPADHLNSDTNTGITSITVSSVSTTVTNESNQMKIETNVTAAIERRTRFLHFFRKTKIETVTWKLESVVTLENEKWVMGSDFLTKIGHEA